MDTAASKADLAATVAEIRGALDKLGVRLIVWQIGIDICLFGALFIALRH